AAPLGELFVTFDATLPTVDMSGRTLDPSDDLTLTAACGSDSRTATGKPGDKVELIIPVDIDGFNDVHISVANSKGHGNARLYTVYAGIDNPLPPANVKGVISEDNLSMTVTWDAVGNVGEHGGYVDVDGVTYDFYNGSTTGFTRVGTAGKNLSYTYRGVLGSQIQVNVGPVAVNFVGTSSNGTFITETLGSLNKIPMIEEWGMAAFTYNKWVSSTTAPYNFVTWSHCTEASAELGDITFNGGALRATNAGASKALGQLIAPRLTTRDVNHVKAVMTYWNYAKAGHMELWGRTYENQEPVKIAELDPSRPAVGEWVEWEVVLPEEFCNQAWIQVNVRCEIASDESVVLENYQILQNVEYDLQVSNVTAPYCAVVGETPTFNVVVNNAGAETISGNLNVELIANGDVVLETVSTPIERLSSGKDFEFDASFKMLESYTKYDFIEVRATTEAADDENKTNNEASAEFLLYEHTVPVVRDLSAVRADNGQDVNLTWTTPDNTYSSIESFEVSQPLANTEEIGRWINVDMDGMAPFTIQGNRWSGDEDPSAWVVYNAKDRNTMSDERLSPHSGDQMLLCRSIQYEDGEYPTRSFDFLVSPEVKGGSKVTFWMNTISSTYAETIDIYYSTTDTNLTGTEFDLTNKDQGPTECGSFKLLRHFTKSGSEGWEKCEFTLPEDAKHFAFVYASFGMFAAMIDDVEYEPVTPGTVDIDSYDVFISYAGETPQCISREVTGTSYTHVTGHDRAATYYVVTNVYDGEYRFQGPLSNPASVDGSGVNELEGGRFVGGGKGRILVGGAEGVACRIFDAEGRTINVATISSDRQVFIVDAGIYLVQLGDDTVKVIVR
ncbi:MAG: choice-of-anchor J domain-containing protein, partial [Muribaculaceae bacterium]|nr:choice-of-anchor J domain-containing protein [Muribaculaceae bacterium]